MHQIGGTLSLDICSALGLTPFAVVENSMVALPAPHALAVQRASAQIAERPHNDDYAALARRLQQVRVGLNPPVALVVDHGGRSGWCRL